MFLFMDILAEESTAFKASRLTWESITIRGKHAIAYIDKDQALHLKEIEVFFIPIETF